MPSDFDFPTFLGTTVPIELVSRMSHLEVQANKLVLECETERYSPEIFNYYGTKVETVYNPVLSGTKATIVVEFWSDEIFRLRYVSGEKVPANETLMVVGQPGHPTEFDVVEDEKGVTVRTAALRLVLVREPWQLIIYDLSGRMIFHTSPVTIPPLSFPEGKAEPVEERWTFLLRYAYPMGVSHDRGPLQAFASFGLNYDEHIYGFGEGFGPFDKRGTLQDLWLRECLSNSSPGAYKQTPFYMSTQGYGLFVNTSNHIKFHVGDLEHTQVSLIVDDTDFLDFFFIYGPKLKDILPRYTGITGSPRVPPKWSFGLWMSRISYNSQKQVEAVAKELREHRIPCDVIHIDTDWFEKDWECNYKFGKEKFPDPAAMMARLRKLGFKVSLWQWPMVVVGTDMFEEGSRNGYLPKMINGKPYIFSGDEANASYVDYSNPQAAAWIQQRITELFRLGAAAIKVDFGEGAEPGVKYHDVPSESMHNLYPLLYARAIFEATEKFWGSDQAVVWARAGWAGSQRYPVHWAGDGIGRYDDLPCVLRSALSIGLSGFPFYSHDIGGFVGNPSPDLYCRWGQFGLFSSHARVHGYPPREPWAYGEKVENIFRQYDDLRYRLLPYIFSEAVECGRTSLPMVRPIVLDYQDDPTTHIISDEYLFGRSLLVAPILDETGRRHIYFPEGKWINFWTKEILEGNRWSEIEVPLQVMPIFVRAGTILPFGPPMQHTGEKVCDPLTLEIYLPGDFSEYRIHDEGNQDFVVSYRSLNNQVEVNTSKAPGRLNIVLYGIEISAASVAGKLCNWEKGADGGLILSMDGREPLIILIKTK